MRVAHERPAGHSATPIYDALCAEYRRLFRALPGDRMDEEELRFPGFGDAGGHSGSGYVTFPVRAGYGAYGAHTGYGAPSEEPGAPALPPAQREMGPGERPPGS